MIGEDPATVALQRWLLDSGKVALLVQDWSDLASYECPVVPDVIVIGPPASTAVHAILKAVWRHDVLQRALQKLYYIDKERSYPLFFEHDFDSRGMFVTSKIDDGLYDDIYRYSLTKVKLKCHIGDAYDLFQCLDHASRIGGDIIEFGSYEGHSGLLMAEYIARRGLDKHLYLCDLFNELPPPGSGIKPHVVGHFVNFQEVQERFSGYPFVHLIRGNFFEVHSQFPDGPFALAMIDCNHPKTSQFVAHYAWERLPEGGLLFLEDYGHWRQTPNRLAIDEVLAQYSEESFNFFSFFSGAQLLMKLGKENPK